MNKRDFLKGTAALSLTPALAPSLGTAATSAAPATAPVAATLPTPAYVYDSVKRVMRFYRADDHSRMMHGYFAHG